MTELTQQLLLAMPGWKIVEPPTSFGRAPTRHFRARLALGDQVEDMVIRQSWGADGHDVESFLYTRVLPELKVRTPKLWCMFVVDPDQPEWMALEDLGENQIRAEELADRKAALYTLGRLHGGSLGLIEQGVFINNPPRRFSKRGKLWRQWSALIDAALQSADFGFEEWMRGFVDDLCVRLANERSVLIHGDTDFSNMIRVDGEVALIDWEHAAIAPPSLDLGRVMEAVESHDELDDYRRGYFESSSRTVSAESMQRWVRLADAYNCLVWVFHYVRRATGGDGPDAKWRETYYEPYLKRLCGLKGMPLSPR